MSDSLSPKQRLALIRHVNFLLQSDFDDLLFALDVPRKVMPSGSSTPGSRSSALLEWVNSPGGCEMDTFLEILDEIAPLPDVLKPLIPPVQSTELLLQPEQSESPDADPESQYLDCQQQECIYNDIEGYRQRNVLLLKEVFVPLKLTQAGHRFGPMGSRNVADEAQLAELLSSDHLTIWDLLRQIQDYPGYSRLVILAQGGYGKTTLLRHVTYNYTTQGYQRFKVPKFTPILLYLRKWREVMVQADAPDLPTLMIKHHIPDLPGGESLSQAWANTLVKEGKALVLIDGFDEVAETQRQGVSQWINRQMRRYPKNVFILTSRPGGYEYYSGQENFKSMVFVQPFKPDQWKSFIRQWYFCYERFRRVQSERHLIAVRDKADKAAQQLIEQIESPERRDLADMVTNPLLLNMITDLHQFYSGGDLPRYRAELYESMCRLQLRDRPISKRLELPLSANDSQQVLQWLALQLQEDTVTQISATALATFIGNALQLKGLAETVTAAEYLKWVCQVNELLVERNTNEYEFSHRSFQSYLAALEIGQRNQEDWLLDQWNHEQDWWHETIILYIAQLDNPNSAIQGLVNRKAADLAYKCLQETSKRITPELEESLKAIANQVQDLRFQDLERYMQEGDWKKADEETYRLMITTVGKEVGNYFTEEELRTFPCEELLIIDGLWRRYSNDRFGFSVQKTIYVDCGAKLNGKYPGDEIWERFYDRVGWADVRYDTQSPEGHLPYLPFGFGWWVGEFSFIVSSLASRLANCSR